MRTRRKRHARYWLFSLLAHAGLLALFAALITEVARSNPASWTLLNAANDVDPHPIIDGRILPRAEPDGDGASAAAARVGHGPAAVAFVAAPTLETIAPERSPIQFPTEGLTAAVPAPAAARGIQAGQGDGIGHGLRGLLDGRSGDRKQELLEEYGGTEASERAVALGLDWLARHQNRDGSWSLHAYNASCQCSGVGPFSDHAGAALGLLPFLGAGYTHQEGMYHRLVERAIEWLLQHQANDGSFTAGAGTMYGHALATIALSEAYAMTEDSRLRPAAEKALRFIAAAQDPNGGGWRYQPRQGSDLSVTGWQLMALASGEIGRLKAPTDVWQSAAAFLDRAQTDTTAARYAYMPFNFTPTPAMTAEGLLSRMFLGWPRDHPSLTLGLLELLEKHPPRIQHRNIYYWYYATQAFHHFGGDVWQAWNEQMRDLLVATQITEGHSAGSWDPQNPAIDIWSARAGRLYLTSLSLLTLEVYYRHLPLYDRLPAKGL